MANTKKEVKNNEQLVIKPDEKIEINKTDLDFLMKRLAKLEEEVGKTKQIQTQVIDDTIGSEEIIDIPLNKSIKAISLYNGGLTLFTQDHCQGKKFRFDKFGDIRTIQYTDLDACISVQRRFFEQGYVMILDKDVVKVHGFEEAYNKLLTKKQIEEILTYENQKIEALFSNTTDNIKQVIVDMVVNKIINNEYVDMNKIQIINKYFPKDINEIIAFMREAKSIKKE